jgi:hypothetical protein
VSLNNKCFAEGNEGAREHKYAKLRTLQFLKANQYFSKTVHPSVGGLHNPPTGAATGMSLLLDLFFSPALDVGNEPA